MNGEWVNNPDNVAGMTNIYYAMGFDGFKDAYSLKAVKRLVHKWDVPKGTKFIASLPYVGYDFYLTKS